ncbi:MAG: cytochrome c oxidase subunit 3 family protein [Acidobacteria bacterium]|nr:cytochrome c oxidase subunit 3 family protein [Acidobacteriota bacterium]
MPDHSTALARQFDDIEQQRESVSLGMWIFLATEIMFFGGMFLGYAIYRASYPEVFAEASRHLDVLLGGINTGVLLCSSLTMALAVHAAQLGARRTVALFLGLTILLGSIFLGIKVVEYHHKYEEHLIPGPNFRMEGAKGSNPQLFFSFYFAMTGMHAFHMVIGVALMAIMILVTLKGRITAEYYAPVEMLGLYWHFVDIVWVFLFPLLYLVDRS